MQWYEILETRVLERGDKLYASEVVRQLKRRNGNAEVRRFERTVKAGTATVPVTVIVARKRLPECPGSRRVVGNYDREQSVNYVQPCPDCAKKYPVKIKGEDLILAPHPLK